jgi:molecular chaperone DnaK (HSP70)
LERKRTRDAGELAGLNVVAILDEPVAAALNYGLNADNRGKTIIVYDLGGGTFDVTVVRIGADGSVEVVCTEGNHQLGGFDWDKKIVDYYISQFQSETGNTGNLLEDPDTAYELRLGAETDKKTLSLKGSVKRKVAFDGDKAIVELTREKFDELMVDLLEKTIVLTDSVLAQIQAKGIKVDTWLLVGGSTRMPQVKDKLCAKYGLTFGENLLEFDVDEAVAKGAAKFGEKSVIITKIGDKIEEKLGGDKKFEDLDKNEQDKVVEEVAEEMGKTKEEIFTLATTSISTVASKSYGIRVLNSQDKPVVYNLIVKQTPIPKEGKEGKQTFRTKGANADSLDLVVYVNNENGQDVEIAVSQELGNAELKLEGNLPEGSPIEIIFNLDEQGKLTLKGIDKTYGKSVEAVFQSDGVMSESEKKIALEKSKDIKVQ